HEGGPKGGSESGYLRENIQRTRGFDCGCDGIRIEPAATGKRDGKLREGGAKDTRKDRAGPDSFGEGGSAAGNERGCDGDDESTWVLTSYLVSNAIVLPLSGWFSGLIGRKKFYMTCVAIFTVSSFLCGLAPSLGVLVIFRILQGVGGGGLQPSEQAILNDTFPLEKRGMAFAVYGLAVVVAPTIGPWLGGWITDNFSWRWIFYINVPVGILSLLLTSFLVSDPPYMKKANVKAGFRI